MKVENLTGAARVEEMVQILLPQELVPRRILLAAGPF